jgi:hypothetical protein
MFIMLTDFKEYMSRSKTERQAHLNLTENCVERGGNSTNHRGVLAQYLDTIIPMGRVAVLAHACNNAKCSNPNHLYWATDKENVVEDGAKFGTHKSPWQRQVDKYGYEEACKLNARGDKTAGGRANKGKPKTEEHKKKIALSMTKK